MDVVALEKTVSDMHRFLGDWLSGALEQNTSELSKFTELLDPEFTLINPDAQVLTYAMVVRQMEDYYAKVPGLEVETRNFEVIVGNSFLAIATYEELQRWPEGANSKAGTVLFLAHANSPHGYRWRHARETWLKSRALTHE